MNFIILVILPQTQSPEVTTFYQFVRIRLRADHDLVLPDPDSFIFDPTNPVPVTPTRAKPDWSAFYSESEEELPPEFKLFLPI